MNAWSVARLKIERRGTLLMSMDIQSQISEFEAQKKSRRIAVSGKPIYNCEFCDARFNSAGGLSCHRGTKHADEYSPRVITCPICRETVKVREKTDGVTVEHCLTHTGHEVRPSQLRLDNNAEQFIVSLLRDDLTVRQHLRISTKEVLRNIASKCRVDPGRLQHLDTVSVRRRVDADLQSDGIQFYRPAQDASGDGFMLVVINPTQKEWLRKYGQRALCVEDTFNLTSYLLRLATVTVADEWDRALPAAYLLSYSKLFPSSWTKRLLCLRQVQQAMKRNANAKMVNRDLSEIFLRKMRDICLVRERGVFVTQYTSMLLRNLTSGI
ncbi:hypothetical protein RB195_003850 [Necator americanus]|uniref:C2H2-type domain-containing protein n=1 Tax=Necator americanus TaxID=51031 RepID=A0ABR1DRP9_NECAM